MSPPFNLLSVPYFSMSVSYLSSSFNACFIPFFVRFISFQLFPRLFHLFPSLSKPVSSLSMSVHLFPRLIHLFSRKFPFGFHFRINISLVCLQCVLVHAISILFICPIYANMPCLCSCHVSAKTKKHPRNHKEVRIIQRESLSRAFDI